MQLKTQSRGSKSIKNYLIIQQGRKCFYCGQVQGEQAIVKRKDRTIYEPIRLTLDHFFPWRENKWTELENSVVCCQFCNKIKNTKIFQDPIEVFTFFLGEWEKRTKPEIFKKINSYISHVLKKLNGTAELNTVACDYLPCSKPFVPLCATARFCSPICSHRYHAAKKAGLIRCPCCSSNLRVVIEDGKYILEKG